MYVLCITSGLWSQESQITQDPAAGQVLDRVASKTKTMKSMQADFELVVEDRKEKTKNASNGNLLMKQNKYRITSESNAVYFDGKVMWTYVKANNEVTITEPKPAAEDFMSNPVLFFSRYKHDFKYRYVRQTDFNGTSCHEIDLFPKNLDQPYSRIKVFIGVTTDLPCMISSIGKDGVDYTVYLRNAVLDREFSDAAFTFDPSKYKKVEIVDMRGIE
jgi:outer membrane lipoprotein-sorting protein